MNIPEFSLKALPYAKALAEAKVFSKSVVNDYLWLNIPVDFAEFHIDYIGRELPTKIDLTELSYRDNLATWIKVPVSTLNTYNTSQLFKIVFRNPSTEDIHNRFFSYSVQTSDVEKPYIYMKQDESTTD